MTREPDVMDVWFDSGSMPFAQWHYPFEHKDDFDSRFPADFISEGIDQTRGWFYSLLAISVLYKGVAPYKNVLVNDLVLDSKGQKMSKSKGNTLNPFELFDRYGADVVRFYSLYVSPPWVPTRFDEEGLKEVNAKFFRTIKNIYQMFALYANTNGWNPADFQVDVDDRPEIDHWLLSRYHSLLKKYKEEMDAFEYNRVVHDLSDFVVEDFSNWYIRRNRRRFWSSEASLDVKSVFRTSYEVLLGVSKLIAPITPFLAEELYQALTREEAMDSVHLEFTPQADLSLIDEDLEKKMDLVRRVVNLGRASREEAGIKVRQPLSELVMDRKFEDTIGHLSDLIKEELNVKELVFSDRLADQLEITLKPDYKVAGRILGGKIKDFAKYLSTVDSHEFLANLEQGPVTLSLQGEDTEIQRDYVEARYQAREGFDVAMDGDISVLLDTQLSPDLVQEGLVREVISKVQQQRKTNDFEVSDRIHMSYEADEELTRAIEAYRENLSQEILATEIQQEKLTDQEPVDINGHPLRFRLQRED